MPPSSLRGWRRLKTVVGVQSVLVTNILMSVVNAEQITTTIHSTHASVNLAPKFCCASTIFNECGHKYDAWTMTTYTSSDGMQHTFHQAQSAGNDLKHWNSTRHMSFTLKGSSVFLYMAPQRFLNHPPGKQEICMYGTCQTLDISGRYKAAGASENPVLMWWAQNLDQDRATQLELRLIDDSWDDDSLDDDTRSMSFQYLTYTHDLENTTRPPLKEGMRLINTTLHDTNYAVDYAPKLSRTDCCGEYNPWDKRLVTSFMGSGSTFHHTSNWGSDPTGDQIRQLSFTFQGAAIYLYGPPPAALEELWGDGLVHGHQEVCLGDQCAGIDVHQAYLNFDVARENDPILLWSFDLLSPNPQSHATFDSFSLDTPTKLRLRLLDPDSPVRGSHLIFDHAVVSEVRSSPLWHHPLPDGWYRSMTVGFNGPITYIPEAMVWSNLTFALSRISTEARDVLFESVLPSWQYTFKGHDIKIYGAPKFYTGNAEHARQKICIDTECRHVDVEQAYLAIGLRDFWKPVLLLHATDLNPFTTHNVSAVAVRNDDDTADPRVMTFHSIEYQMFTAGAPPLPKPAPEPWLNFDWSDLLGLLAPRNILLAIVCAPLALVACSCAIHVIVGILMALRTAIRMLPILIRGVGDLLRTIPAGVACVATSIRAGVASAMAGIWLVHDGTGYLLTTLPVRFARAIIGAVRRTTRKDLETGSETEPLLQDRAPLPRTRPPSFSSAQNSTFTPIQISQHPPPPYIPTAVGNSWVIGTPPTTNATPAVYIPTHRVVQDPVVATMPMENNEAPNGVPPSRAAQASNRRLQRGGT